jgi:hypothetical protein
MSSENSKSDFSALIEAVLVKVQSEEDVLRCALRELKKGIQCRLSELDNLPTGSRCMKRQRGILLVLNPRCAAGEIATRISRDVSGLNLSAIVFSEDGPL